MATNFKIGNYTFEHRGNNWFIVRGGFEAPALESTVVLIIEYLQVCAERDEFEIALNESRAANVCPWCGYVGDFYFDRTWEHSDNPEGEGMHYRCQKCGKSIEYAEAKIPELEKEIERLQNIVEEGEEQDDN